MRYFPRRVASLTLIEPVAFHLLRQNDELDDWREVAALAEQHIALTAQGHDIEASRAFIAYWMESAAWQQMPDAVRDSIIRTMPKVAAEWRLMFALPTISIPLPAAAPNGFSPETLWRCFDLANVTTKPGLPYVH